MGTFGLQNPAGPISMSELVKIPRRPRRPMRTTRRHTSFTTTPTPPANGGIPLEGAPFLTKKSNDARWSGCVVFFSFSASSGFLLTRCARLCVPGQTQYSWSRRVAGNLPVPCIKLDLVRDRLLLSVTLNPLVLTPCFIFSRKPSPLLEVYASADWST